MDYTCVDCYIRVDGQLAMDLDLVCPKCHKMTLIDIPLVCPDCEQTLGVQVLHSAAGYYIGTWCNCGPYSRESEYFKTHELAEAELWDRAMADMNARAEEQGVEDDPNFHFEGEDTKD